ncbi:uncharacterized protein AB675_8730 [Cyphellophora attinorum]|uniref:Uncharacterized protein n=1 Tax=Cyphellophora attinorum TaxID=1664694 RepID=A0A0N0NR09_9EURO|nr:uncharacterized protein AB675_8730 [Phialophora attinorum]KPI44289.1 hypothetical protein AB675_8730 [Phialophora attinorum]
MKSLALQLLFAIAALCRDPCGLARRDTIVILTVVTVIVQPVYYSELIPSNTVIDPFRNGHFVTVTNAPTNVIILSALYTTITSQKFYNNHVNISFCDGNLSLFFFFFFSHFSRITLNDCSRSHYHIEWSVFRNTIVDIKYDRCELFSYIIDNSFFNCSIHYLHQLAHLYEHKQSCRFHCNRVHYHVE